MNHGSWILDAESQTHRTDEIIYEFLSAEGGQPSYTLFKGQLQ